MPRPSLGQTRKLIQMWLDERAHSYLENRDKTMAVLIRHGWVVPTGETCTYPSGQVGMLYVLSDSGLQAAQVGFANVTLNGKETSAE